MNSAGAPLELVDVETVPPRRDEVRLTVSACGICGTDAHFVSGAFPGMSWPFTPGHEIAGKIAELGDGIEGFAVGDRVAVGWFGGCCYHCDPCRKGIFIHCVNGKVPSWQYPGGYAESVTVPVSALARIPDGLSDAEAAPMGCAGVTTYNALRHTKALPGDRVAILGVGGLAPQGELVTIGVTPEPLPISPLQLINSGLSIVGHPSGTAKDIEDTMQFAVLSGVRAWIEELPLSQAAEGYQALEQGRAHYRTVLTM